MRRAVSYRLVVNTVASEHRREPLLVTAGQVILRPEQPALKNGAVLINGDGTIGDLGPESAVSARHPHARELRFPSSTMLPGLINAHVHLAFEATSDPVAALTRGDRPAIRHTIASHARALLDTGITTARDLGDRYGLVGQIRDEIATGTSIGPRVLSAFAPLTSPQGHCWFLGGEVADEEAMRAAVKDLVASGADLIKVMAGGGRLTPKAAPVWKSQFTRAEVRAAVDTAHAAGLRVAAHAHGTETMALCAEVGVDTIEHGGWLTGPTADPRCYDPRSDVADLIAEKGIAVCPTRSREWKSWPPEAGLDGLLARLSWMRSQGISLIAGTDAGVGAGKYDDLVEALTLYEAAGWSPSEALATATTIAATALGREHKIGTLAPGYSADILVVDGDPLVDLEALRSVQCVITGGRLHSPPPTEPA